MHSCYYCQTEFFLDLETVAIGYFARGRCPNCGSVNVIVPGGEIPIAPQPEGEVVSHDINTADIILTEAMQAGAEAGEQYAPDAMAAEDDAIDVAETGPQDVPDDVAIADEALAEGADLEEGELEDVGSEAALTGDVPDEAAAVEDEADVAVAVEMAMDAEEAEGAADPAPISDDTFAAAPSEELADEEAVGVEVDLGEADVDGAEPGEDTTPEEQPLD